MIRLPTSAVVRAVLVLCACATSAQDAKPRTIHVFVALADNQHQGIVPVAPVLGNGEDGKHNLYWGSAYGVKTFFSRSAEWARLSCGKNPKPPILERCIFKYRSTDVYLIGAFVGHVGLMDVRLPLYSKHKDGTHRDAIVLACASKQFFGDAVRASGAYPLLWTTGLMAPEAYTLKAVLDGWIAGENQQQIRDRAAAAYDKYQKCGLQAAHRLLTSGW